MKLPTIALAAALAVLPALALAPVQAMAHGPATGPHGGAMADVGPYHAELVIAGTDVVLYVSDGNDKQVDVTGATAEATILVDKKVTKVTLAPAGGNALKGAVDLGGSHASVKVVTSLTMPGQKPLQARFETGHAGH